MEILTLIVPLWMLILLCLLACCGIMFAVWRWAVKIGNASVVDIFWAFNFAVIGLLTFLLGSGSIERKALISSLVITASIRLGWHLGVRVMSHLDEEEGRYQQLRKEWAPHADRKFGWFFQMQAFSNVLLALPFFLIASNETTTLSPVEYVGAAIWLIAFAGETIADKQLATFKKDRSNAGKVCDAGLWKYSRHPNYFFEWLMWAAYFVIALGSPYGWLGILSPAIILYLLLRVTGIPATEQQSLRSKGQAYAEYQRRTSAFVPMPLKKRP